MKGVGERAYVRAGSNTQREQTQLKDRIKNNGNIPDPLRGRGRGRGYYLLCLMRAKSALFDSKTYCVQ